MARHTLLVIGLVALAGSCIGPAVALAGPVRQDSAGVRQIARVPNETELEAFRGRLVWSRLDREAERFRLITRYGGRTSRVPIPGRKTAFDVDLGPGPGGRTVAVYSRCRVEPGPFPRVARPRGCGLFLYDFERRRERRLRRVGVAGRSEFRPSIWRNRVAFASVPDRPPTPEEVSGDVRVRSLDGGGQTDRYLGSGAPLADSPDPAVLSVDLRGDQLVFVWKIVVDRCRADEEPDQLGFGSEHHELWLARGTGTKTLVEKGCAGRDPAGAFLNPYLTSNTVGYGVKVFGDGIAPRFWVRTHHPASRRYAEARAVSGLRSYVQSGASAWLARGSRQTRIERSPALRLAPTQAYPSSSAIGPPVGSTVPADAR